MLNWVVTLSKKKSCSTFLPLAIPCTISRVLSHNIRRKPTHGFTLNGRMQQISNKKIDWKIKLWTHFSGRRRFFVRSLKSLLSNPMWAFFFRSLVAVCIRLCGRFICWNLCTMLSFILIGLVSISSISKIELKIYWSDIDSHWFGFHFHKAFFKWQWMSWKVVNVDRRIARTTEEMEPKIRGLYVYNVCVPEHRLN